MAEQMKARDMDAPVKTLSLDGQTNTLRFCNEAARVAEDVYEEQYHRDAGYADILKEISRMKYRAIMAVFYGALVAGGCGMSWETFDRTFNLGAVDGIEEMILSGVTRSLPEETEGGAKNG